MLLSAIIGAFCGTIVSVAWAILQSVGAGFIATLGANGLWVGPMALGVLALFELQQRGRKSPELNEPIADLAEEFHFGIQRVTSAGWALRAALSSVGQLFGIFGAEGLAIEGAMAVQQGVVSRFPKSSARFFLHDIDIRQIIIDAALAGAFSVVLGAPFTAALLALEAFSGAGNRARVGAFTSALAAYGAWRLLSAPLGLEHHDVLHSLFVGYKATMPEGTTLLLSGLAMALLGAAAACMLSMLGWALAQLKAVPAKIKWSSTRAVVAGAAILALTALATPATLDEPWRLAQEMAWAHLTTPSAAVAMVARVTALLIAGALFGSSGLLTPLLLITALFGYAVGNALGLSWSLPMAMALAPVAVLAAFGAPLASAALALEVLHDGYLWWLSLMALGGAGLALRALRSPNLVDRLLTRRGMRMVSGRSMGLLSDIQVKDAMVSDHASILESASLAEIQRQAMASPYNVLGVVDDEDLFRGLLTLDRLPNHPDLKGISSRDLLDEDAVSVEAQLSLEDVYAQLGQAPALAVVDDKGRLVGLLFKSLVDARYHREVGRKALSYYASQTFK